MDYGCNRHTQTQHKTRKSVETKTTKIVFFFFFPVGLVDRPVSLSFLHGTGGSKDQEGNGMAFLPEYTGTVIRDFSLLFFVCLRLDGGVRGRNHWENFVVFGFPKAQSYKEKTSHHLALDHKKKHTTAYKNGWKKEKVCAVWALAFVHREEKERRSNMPWPSQLFW